MKTARIRILTRAAAAAILLFAAWIAAAQVADATLEVVVSDESGAPLPGVSVRVTRADTGLARQSVSDGVGVARIPALPPGTYQLLVELPGIPPVTQENVALRVGQTARVKVTLQMRQAEAVTVSAAVPVVDVYKTDSSTNIVPEQIEDLPVADRDFQKLAFIAPGVQRERGGFRFIGGGPVVGAGGNASQTTILVDGVDFTDPALGLARTRFSQDAISEFRVIMSRFDSEIGGSQGGALSVVTRSGTNDFHGMVFGFVRDDSLREKGELEQQKNEYSRESYGFTLGGPFVRDRTHWFVSYEQVNEDNITLFRPGGAYAGLAADEPHPFEQDLAFASLDYRISDSQSLSAKGVYETYSEDNFRVGTVADVSSGQQLNRDNWNASLSHVWVPGSRTTNELRGQYGERSYDEPLNSTAPAEYFSSGNTLITGGNILGDLLGEGDMWEIRDTFALRGLGPKGSHDLKA
ncbi:MAG: TonB-dependent receptor, partial [Acidobacteriota bacterium]|nr:TonB-dependent receptor [Acidobacteriota bacterium]